ncbi:hypothetical protein [Aurantiacibacter arachoides]|uniref:hypothetical protein n=1 Tax=Aurantiacibacter arachoides TaxID=1850444 RepID=UPI0018F8C601|nr:hypothetical protein [Aurantiacibacter arachoides]
MTQPRRTKRLPPLILSLSTRDEAFAAERRIKGWSRAKKEALIAGDWDEISRLARNRQGEPNFVRHPSTSSG